jgi:acyl carrier protein
MRTVERDFEEAVKAVMSDVLGLDPATITDATARDNTAAWDSANHISLVLALEEEFEITFDVAEFEAMLTFSDIIQLLEAKF